MSVAGFRPHIDGAVLDFLECCDPVAECEPDTMVLEARLRKASELRIHWRQNLAGHLHEGDFDAKVNQIFGHLHPDEPAADDDGAHPPLTVVALINPFLDLPGIGHGANLKIRGRSIPGKGGRMDTAPGDRTSLS